MKRDKSNITPDFDKMPDNTSIAIIVAKFNSQITDSLLSGAKKALEDIEFTSKNNSVKVFEVPGSVELPLAAATAADTGKYEAIICFGAIIKGDTDHYKHVCQMTSDGIGNVSLEYKIPVMFGVLTCDNEDQAKERIKKNESNMGYQVAIATVDIIKTLSEIKKS